MTMIMAFLLLLLLAVILIEPAKSFHFSSYLNHHGSSVRTGISTVRSRFQAPILSPLSSLSPSSSSSQIFIQRQPISLWTTSIASSTTGDSSTSNSTTILVERGNNNNQNDKKKTKLNSNSNNSNNNNYHNKRNNNNNNSRLSHLRGVIRSIETFGQDDNINNNNNNNAQSQQQQADPQLLAILRLLYYARTTKQVTEAGKELEELLLVVTKPKISTTTTISNKIIASPSPPTTTSTTTAATVSTTTPTSSRVSPNQTPKPIMTTDIWNRKTCRPIQERLIKACALAGLMSLATTLLQQMLQPTQQQQQQQEQEQQQSESENDNLTRNKQDVVDDDEDEESYYYYYDLPSSLAYTAVCDSLKHNGRCEQIEDVLLQLAHVARRSRSSTNNNEQHVHIIAFNTYLACLCQKQSSDLNQGTNYNNNNNNNNYNNNNKINRYHNRNQRDRLDLAWKYLQPGMAQKIFAISELDITSYNTVLHGAASVGNRTLADWIWDEMLQKRQQQQQQQQESVSYKNDTNTEDSNNKFQLDLRSYNARLLSLDRDPAARLKLFQEEIVSHRQPPKKKKEEDKATSSSANMNTTDTSGSSTVAQQQRRRLVSSSSSSSLPSPLQPDRFTIDLVLVPLIQAGRIGDVENLLDDFVSRNSPRVASDAFGAFFSTLVQEGEISTARALFDTYVLPSLHVLLQPQIQEVPTLPPRQEQQATRTTRISSVSLRQLDNKKKKLNNKSISKSALLIHPTVKHFNILINGYRRLAEEYKKQEIFHKNRVKEQNQPTLSSWSSASSPSSSNKKRKIWQKQQEYQKVDTEEIGPIEEDREEMMDPQLAREEGQALYSLLVDHFHLTPDDYTVTSMMGLYATSEELSDFLLRQPPPQGTIIRNSLSSPVVLRAAMTAYGQVGDPSTACIVFDRFGGPNTMNTRTWNVLLNAIADGAKRNDVELKFSKILRSLDDTNQLKEEKEDGDDYVLDDNINQKANENSINPQRPSGNDRSESVPSIVSFLDGATCTEAVQIMLNQMRSSSPMAPSPNTQTYCIVASALQHRTTTDGSLALELFRNATTKDGMVADGRFVNAILRCFGEDIQAALVAWKGEIRPACFAYEQRPRNAPPSGQRSRAKNLIAAYNGLLYVCGRALRPDIAVRVAYAMNREGIEPNSISLNCYHSGKRMRQRLESSSSSSINNNKGVTSAASSKDIVINNAVGAKDVDGNDVTFKSDEILNNNKRFGFVSEFGRKTVPKLPKLKILPQIDFVDQYENLLYVECTKYDRNDIRRKGDKRVRIIL